LPEIPRGDSCRQLLAQHYSGIDELWKSRLDGLIVTGTEPFAADLRDEPYWTSLISVLDWAEDSCIPTVWSCLAAHAIVLHLSGIRRRKLPEKCTGVFSCTKAGTHALTLGMREQFLVPHSRLNGLSEEELDAAGYTILARSPEAGVDMFARDGSTPFLFVQGHPEYGAYTLLREYRRDIGRFLRGELRSYPAMPQGYFDAETAAHFRRFRERALIDRPEESLTRLWTSCPEPVLSNTWRSTATCLYGNWLSLLAARKAAPATTEQRLELGHGHVDSREALRH
jgi:homoserine O-succinyltransferase